MSKSLIELSADIIAAQAEHRSMTQEDMAQGLRTVFQTLRDLHQTYQTTEPGDPEAKSDVYDRWAEQRVAWNELYSPDLEGAKAFYARHFNFEFNESMPMGDMGDYCFIDHGGETIGAMMQKPPHVPVGCWNYYIRVPDIDSAKAAIESGGGQVLNGPMQVPDGDWVINGMDPQRAPFSLVGARKE